ncbi:thioesterase domain-containing protein, partial [Mesorhizobium sp. NPDC059054]|uniref:thioesterase domain-containing protein n=1 Tax=Mesorhizobium sp. NPDC059054 TaxID=3346711 RepID=UPI00369B5ADA
TMLAGLWSELLGVERIGRRDSFFILGGHSLLVVRLVARIRQELGKVVTIQDVLVQPTIEGIASAIRKLQIRPNTVEGVVELNSAGSQRPLFIVHPSSGEVGAYPALALAIGKDIPVFGLEAAGLRDDLLRAETVEQIAEEYLSRIRKVQPTGPYRLAAWSLGGVIAYEMARQLANAHENVEFLGLIDCANNHAVGYAAPRYKSDIDDLLLRLKELVPAFQIGELTGWRRGPRTAEHLINECRRAGYFDDGLTAQDVLRRTKVWRHLVSAAERYVPLPSSVAIHLFLARTSSESELANSWRLLVGNRLTVEKMEGDHLSMMEIPLCNPLGASIARALTSGNTKPFTTAHEHPGKTIAFILFPETSAFNASYNLARALKGSGHRIIYHGPARYSSRVAGQGFEYRSLDMPIPQAERSRGRGFRATLGRWRAAQLQMWHLLVQIRASDIRCETALIADQTDLIITDPSAKIGVIPALKLKIPMIALNSTLASSGTRDTPPVFSSLMPPAVRTFGWKLRNSFAWSRCLFAAWRKQAASAGMQIVMGLGRDPFWAEVRRLGGTIRWNEYGPHIAVPELVTSPRTFDFPHSEVDASRTYLGSSVDLRRSDGDFCWDGYDAEKKLIYCSLGTYSHEYRHAKRLFLAVINAVKARDDIQAIVQVGSAAEVSDFGELPGRIRVVKFAPQLEILEKADVFVTQAGHGSVMEALYFGVPMLTFPCWFDQFGNAARVRYHGLGICGDIATIDETEIARLLDQLDRSEVKDAVLRMQKVFRTQAKPIAGVELIERMMPYAGPAHRPAGLDASRVLERV